MKKNISILLGILLCLVTIMADTDTATTQTESQAIKTNKDKVITIAVQSKIAPAQPSSYYITTWDGKPKMAIGICIHGWSQLAGHGPGLNPVLTAMPGRIKVKIDPNANTAYYLGIKERSTQ